MLNGWHHRQSSHRQGGGRPWSGWEWFPWKLSVYRQCPFLEDGVGGSSSHSDGALVGTAVVGSDKAGCLRPRGLEVDSLARAPAPPIFWVQCLWALRHEVHTAPVRLSPGPGRGVPSCRSGRAFFGSSPPSPWLPLSHLTTLHCKGVWETAYF